MQLIAQTGPRGRVVRANATTLAQALAQGSSAMQVAADVFQDGEVVTVGEEDLRVETHGVVCTVSRGVNGTADEDHAAGQNVRRAAGAELLSRVFDGAAYLSAIRCGGEVEALFGIETDGGIKYIAPSTPYQLEVLFPMARYQPAEGFQIRVLVWTWAGEAVFWAEMQA
jgi:hypothetical protein